MKDHHGQIMAALREAVVGRSGRDFGRWYFGAFPHTLTAPLWVMGEVGGIAANAVNGGDLTLLAVQRVRRVR